jgi:hypothetical protein
MTVLAGLRLWAVTLFLVALIPLAIGWSQLPEEVATHWGWSGEPDGSMALALVPLLMIGVLGVGWLIGVLFRIDGVPTVEAFVVLGLMGGLATALNGLLVSLNRGVGSWEDAGRFEPWHVAVVLVGMFVGGLAGLILGRKWCPPRPSNLDDPPVMVIGPGERVSWVGRASARWPLILIGIAVSTFLFLPEWGAWLGGLLLVIALAFTHVEASVDVRGLRVRLGVFPARRIELAKISSARPIDLEPTDWGGWGWRVVPNGSAIVLRRGEALELILSSGRRFAVTVDDAAVGAALVNGLIARSGGVG